MENHPRIGRVRWQNRINSLRFVGCLSFIETEHHSVARFMDKRFPQSLKPMYPLESEIRVVVCLTEKRPILDRETWVHELETPPRIGQTSNRGRAL